MSDGFERWWQQQHVYPYVGCTADHVKSAWKAGREFGQGDTVMSKPSEWQPMETAPKGGGAECVSDPKWVEPPRILLLFDGDVSVAYWDWYYAEGGSGYRGGLAWIEPCSGKHLDLHYDAPTAWMPIPPKL
jgi:hypothetical protein